jgi:hypothetical protein
MNRRLDRPVLAALAALLLAGCVSNTVRTVDMTPPRQANTMVPEELLLDVGVDIFDPNVPEDYDDQVKDNIAPEIRRAEGNYMAYFLKNLLQSTGNWGSVRVVPRPTHAVDVIVSGKIQHSDGESLVVDVEVHDASGQQWFAKRYEGLAAKYAYEDTVPRDIDPFQAVYKQISDDLLAYREQLTASDVRRIRTVAEMKFARDFAPDAFGDHVTTSRNGEFVVTRLPAVDDPMLSRVRKVREREYLFIDTLDEYFAEFDRKMYNPYKEWRHATFEDAIALKELQAQARSRMIAGGAAIIGGIAAQGSDSDITQIGGYGAIVGGAMTVKSAFTKKAEAQIHREVLQELGTSAEAEISPHTIELENQTVELSGTVDAQYDELKRVLRKIYYDELGLPPPPPARDSALKGPNDTSEARQTSEESGS